jgi:hypothetical protein
MELPNVRVTQHAVSQAMMRSPDLRETVRRHGRVAVLIQIRSEVQGALMNGRRSVTEPRWLVFHEAAGHRRRPGGTRRRGKRGKALNGSRYVWNETESRAYVVSRDGDGWYVKTALARAGA